jgi:hypothetical protein
VNGQRSLSFLLLETDRNSHSFPNVLERAIIEYRDVRYRIKDVDERTIRDRPVKQVSAEHEFFDLIDEYFYAEDKLDEGTYTIAHLLGYVFAKSDYTFSVIDSFADVKFESFGDNTGLALFTEILDRFGAEFDIVGTDVRIRSKVSRATDIQIRYARNVKSFVRSVKVGNLSTYIRGYANKNEDDEYEITSEYRSPLADIFGDLHARPLYLDDVTDQSVLDAQLQAQIEDTYEVTLTVDFVEFGDKKPRMGDEVFVVIEPLNVDIKTRVMEIEDYPESYDSAKITLSSISEKPYDISIRHTKNTLDKIYDENTKRIRHNVLDEAVRRATEALNNSLTELEYPKGQGILARDPNDPDKFVVFRSAGLGITTNGGLTYDEAITALGINTSLLTAGQIKTNNIQIIGNDDLFYWDGNALMAIDSVDANKYVQLNSDGLYIAKGALSIERPDGYVVVNDGILQNEFAIQPTSPPFTSGSVNTVNRYWNTTSTSPQECNAFFYRHDSKYLKVRVVLYAEDSSTGSKITIREIGGGGADLAQTTTYETSQSVATDNPVTLTIDLGAPTGQQRGFYLMLNTEEGGRGYGRLLKAWLEG